MTNTLSAILSRELPLRRTPFARLFTETNTPHRFEKGHEYHELPVCARCGGFEGGLLMTCPIQWMTFAEGEIAYKAFGVLMDEFRDHMDAKRAAGLDTEDEPRWNRGFAPTITEYNAQARLYNDRMLDVALEEGIEKT